MAKDTSIGICLLDFFVVWDATESGRSFTMRKGEKKGPYAATVHSGLGYWHEGVHRRKKLSKPKNKSTGKYF